MPMTLLQRIHHELNSYSTTYRHRHHLMLKIRRNRGRFFLFLSIFIILFMYAFGVFVHPFELDFETNFQYPLHTNDFRYFIESAKQDLNNNALKPINNYSYHYHLNPKHKCLNSASPQYKNESSLYPITLLIVVKSATCNFLNRNVIRQTWGYENRFSDVTIRTVFMLGRCSVNGIEDDPYDATRQSTCDNTFLQYPRIIFSRQTNRFRKMLSQNQTVQCQQVIDMESELYGDIVQADFVDSYYNNTLKTMASLQWTVQHCSQVPFIFFVDDDYYVSIKNLLKFSRNFLQIANRMMTMNSYNEYENEIENMINSDDDADDSDEDRRLKKLVATTMIASSHQMKNSIKVNYNKSGDDNNKNSLRDNPSYLNGRPEGQQQWFDGRLYAGFVFSHSRPHRHVTSKWYVKLDEYPYNRYPPYVTGGCFLVNNQTAIDLYYASLFTKPFKYDDVYLGILANKMKIQLLANNQQMHFYKLPYDYIQYASVIASHGYHDPHELWQIWNEQKSFGNA